MRTVQNKWKTKSLFHCQLLLLILFNWGVINTYGICNSQWHFNTNCQLYFCHFFIIISFRRKGRGLEQFYFNWADRVLPCKNRKFLLLDLASTLSASASFTGPAPLQITLIYSKCSSLTFGLCPRNSITGGTAYNKVA